jgi:phosphoenolpyruvate-protein phosphotransferase
MPNKAIYGIGSSPGIAIGPIFRYHTLRVVAEPAEIRDSQAERKKLEVALQQAQQQIHTLFINAQQQLTAEDASIFEAHELFLSDPELLQLAHTKIEQEHSNAAFAWQQATNQYADQLRALGDEYLAARAVDLEDVSQRVLRLLQGAAEEVPHLTEPAVIVATDLTPSETILFERGLVLAFCTAVGGPTSHVAILAKALGIPAITGLGEALKVLSNGSQVIVDGTAGVLLFELDSATLQTYQLQQGEQGELQRLALSAASQPAITQDGQRVEVVANIGSPEDAEEALSYGAEGIGLLRTEFLFLERETAPTEEEQFAIYRRIFAPMESRPIVVRSFDIGGDKPLVYLTMPPELNPFLGVRGIRLALAEPELFQTQLRALLRAGVGSNLKIMFPMITTASEIEEARTQVQAAQAALKGEGQACAEHFELGIMVEVPATAILADLLVGQVDFFSIGTNDLAQYTLAADRTNASVASLADALHPAVLRQIRLVVEAAHAQGKWVGVCGELAGDPLAAPILLGLGVDELSMSLRSIPLLKQTIRGYTMAQAREIAQQALNLRAALEVRNYVRSLKK